MKILIVMAVLSAAIALNTAQSASDSTHISAAYPDKLELVLSTSGSDLNMQSVSPGKEGHVSCELLVRANVDWTLDIDGENYGYMQKGSDKTKRPQKKLKARYTGTMLSPAETELDGSPVFYCSGHPGEILIPTEFRQKFSWSDPPVKYRMNIRFELSAN